MSDPVRITDEGLRANAELNKALGPVPIVIVDLQQLLEAGPNIPDMKPLLQWYTENGISIIYLYGVSKQDLGDTSIKLLSNYAPGLFGTHAQLVLRESYRLDIHTFKEVSVAALAACGYNILALLDSDPAALARCARYTPSHCLCVCTLVHLEPGEAFPQSVRQLATM